MIKRRSRALAIMISLCLLSPDFSVFGAEKGTWDLAEDGKRWMFFYSPGNPAEDEWIEDEGKEYYVDSKGYMKTGWVKDKRDGKKYYMGEDGAKCFNMLTPDDRYVGPEGVILESFDAWRKAVKKQLNSVMKDKAYKEAFSSGQPGFLLTDLNGDGYPDIAAVNQADTPGRLILVAVWDPEEEKIIVSSEADLEGAEKSGLFYQAESQSLWLVVDAGNGWDRDYFVMDEGGWRFENVWHFAVEMDDWGDPEYYVNGVKSDEYDWNQSIAMAESEAGSAIQGTFLPLDGEHVKQAADRAPSLEELPLWQP